MICASSCVIKNAYKGECGSVSPGLYQDMPSHNSFCVWSDSGFIFSFTFLPYSLFYPNFICKTHLHVWVVATSISCIPTLNFTAEHTHTQKKNFFPSTQEKIHKNLKNPRQHFETSKEKDTIYLNIFYNSSVPFFIQPPPTGKEMSYLKGDWLLVTIQWGRWGGGQGWKL